MGHFSDSAHIDTCAGKNCNSLELRSNMKKIEGRRGYFCTRCQMIWKPKKTKK